MGLEKTEKCKLYIRYPAKIKDEFVIRDLHPNIVGVHLPRQKSRRWCIIDFASIKDLEEAKSSLKKIKINNKKIKFRSYQKGPVKTEKLKKKTVKEEASTNSLVKFLKKD